MELHQTRPFRAFLPAIPVFKPIVPRGHGYRALSVPPKRPQSLCSSQIGPDVGKSLLGTEGTGNRLTERPTPYRGRLGEGAAPRRPLPSSLASDLLRATGDEVGVVAGRGFSGRRSQLP